MAATFTLSQKKLLQDYVLLSGTFVLDSSYANGGETIDLSAYFSSSPIVLCNALSATYGYRHDGGTAAAGKIVAYVLADGSSPDSGDLSAVTGNLIAIGPGY